MNTVTIQDVYKEVVEVRQQMVSKEELASLLETIEILHHPETLQQVRASEADIKAGRTKRITGIKDLLAEMD